MICWKSELVDTVAEMHRIHCLLAKIIHIFLLMTFQRIRDPLHNLIEFADKELERNLWRVIQTQPFQRLRRIKQLGFSDFVYPGACHSRFAHSVGVFHTARELMGVIRAKSGESGTRESMALAAALVHDVGHGPFSHAFETVGKRLDLKLANHESVSDLLIKDSEISEIFNEMGSGFASDVADFVKKEGAITVHNAVVSSQFDTDRLDYMRRDRLMAGSQHAAIDFQWLVANLEIAPVPVGVDDEPAGSIDTFVIGPKAIHAAEAYVLGLFQLYPTIYFHKTTRGAEKLFTELLIRIVELAQNSSFKKTGLPNKHPIIQFAKKPIDMNCVLPLDDTVFWGALSQMAEAEDKVVSELSKRLKERQLYKCKDIRAEVSHSINPKCLKDDELLKNIDACCEKIKEKLTIFAKDNGREFASILIDEARRTPYKKTSGYEGLTERINVRTEGDVLVDLRERSPVVASLSDFVLLRAYCDPEDMKTKSFIEQTIQEEVRNGSS